MISREKLETLKLCDDLPIENKKEFLENQIKLANDLIEECDREIESLYEYIDIIQIKMEDLK